jgi:hypothetical protein
MTSGIISVARMCEYIVNIHMTHDVIRWIHCENDNPSWSVLAPSPQRRCLTLQIECNETPRHSYRLVGWDNLSFRLLNASEILVCATCLEHRVFIKT